MLTGARRFTMRSHRRRVDLEGVMLAKLAAEFLGTFWLVLGGCGSAVLAAAFPELGIGFAGVSLAFGLTVLTAVYALGPISGGHFNPAVTMGLWAGGRFPARHIASYIAAQLAGGIAATAILYVIASGQAEFDVAAGFAANGYGAHSPGGYSLGSALLCELVMTFMFLVVILGATHQRAPVGFAGIAIGLALTLIHLITIPVTNTSVNPDCGCVGCRVRLSIRAGRRDSGTARHRQAASKRASAAKDGHQLDVGNKRQHGMRVYAISAPARSALAADILARGLRRSRPHGWLVTRVRSRPIRSGNEAAARSLAGSDLRREGTGPCSRASARCDDENVRWLSGETRRDRYRRTSALVPGSRDTTTADDEFAHR